MTSTTEDKIRPGGGEKDSPPLGLFHSHVYTYRTPWEKVAQALWQRYPNPYSSHVLSEDILRRQIKDQRLLSRRLLRKTNSAPKWLERFVGGKGAQACIIEESEVDAKTKTFTTYTRNINFNRLMSVEEKAVYTVSTENKEWTSCRKEAWVRCKVRGISRAVERFGVERYRKNAEKAQLGLEFVIEKIFNLRLHILASPVGK